MYLHSIFSNMLDRLTGSRLVRWLIHLVNPVPVVKYKKIILHLVDDRNNPVRPDTAQVRINESGNIEISWTGEYYDKRGQVDFIVGA